MSHDIEILGKKKHVLVLFASSWYLCTSVGLKTMQTKEKESGRFSRPGMVKNGSVRWQLLSQYQYIENHIQHELNESGVQKITCI